MIGAPLIQAHDFSSGQRAIVDARIVDQAVKEEAHSATAGFGANASSTVGIHYKITIPVRTGSVAGLDADAIEIDHQGGLVVDDDDVVPGMILDLLEGKVSIFPPGGGLACDE